MGERLSHQRCGHHDQPLVMTPDGPRCRSCSPEKFRGAASPQGDAGRDVLAWLASLSPEDAQREHDALIAAGYRLVPPGHHVVRTGEVVLDDEGCRARVAVLAHDSVECLDEGDMAALLRPFSEGGDE